MRNRQDSYQKNYNGLYRGQVEVVEGYDSESGQYNIGRCKIRVASLNSKDSPSSNLYWARPIALSPIGLNRGSVCLPKVGDIVWVMFEGGNPDYPVYIGGTYRKGDISINPDEVVLYTEDGNSISYNREHKKFSINIGDNSIEVSNKSIAIEGNMNISGSIKASSLEVSGTIRCNKLIVNGHEWKPED